MCRDGQVRAAYTGTQILNGNLQPSDIENMAHKGEQAVVSGASTHKRNLIYHIIHRHQQCGDLEDFVNSDGDFILNNGQMSNVFSEENKVVLSQLQKTGKLHD